MAADVNENARPRLCIVAPRGPVVVRRPPEAFRYPQLFLLRMENDNL